MKCINVKCEAEAVQDGLSLFRNKTTGACATVERFRCDVCRVRWNDAAQAEAACRALGVALAPKEKLS